MRRVRGVLRLKWGKVVSLRDFGAFVSQHGCGISPIVYDGKVILGNEQDSEKFVKEVPRTGTSGSVFGGISNRSP
jgi:hypothetical protein